MKSDVVTTIGLVFESYILQVDGEVKSEHRRFVDALRAAVQLKQSSRKVKSQCVRQENFGRACDPFCSCNFRSNT